MRTAAEEFQEFDLFLHFENDSAEAQRLVQAWHGSTARSLKAEMLLYGSFTLRAAGM